MAVIGILVTFIGLAILVTVLNAWALVKLWSWFIVPLFDLPPLSVPFAIGIALVAGLFAPLSNNENKKQNKSTSDAVSNVIVVMLRPVPAVLVGYIVTLFIG